MDALLMILFLIVVTSPVWARWIPLPKFNKKEDKK
jgi:hypothetical protein